MGTSGHQRLLAAQLIAPRGLQPGGLEVQESGRQALAREGVALHGRGGRELELIQVGRVALGMEQPHFERKVRALVQLHLVKGARAKGQTWEEAPQNSRAPPLEAVRAWEAEQMTLPLPGVGGSQGRPWFCGGLVKQLVWFSGVRWGEWEGTE